MTGYTRGGILEYWNIGILEKIAETVGEASFPSFHHSIIPFFPAGDSLS
jgi:hypothetical protein